MDNSRTGRNTKPPDRFAHWLSLVPLGAELLLRFQAEEGVPGHVVHLVVHDPVRLGIKTLQEPEVNTNTQSD